MLPIQSLAISDNTTEHSHSPCHLIWEIFNRHDYFQGSSLRKDCNRRLYIHQVQWLGELNKERQGGERDKREAQQIIHKSVGTPTSCDHVELSSFPPLFLIPTLLPSLHICSSQVRPASWPHFVSSSLEFALPQQSHLLVSPYSARFTAYEGTLALTFDDDRFIVCPRPLVSPPHPSSRPT